MTPKGTIATLLTPAAESTYTPIGYKKAPAMNHDHDPARREAKVKRLNRIAGQVAGVARMVAEDRYCIDILTQVQAIKAALARAEAEILRDHAATCVRDAVAAGDAGATQAKLDELVDLFDRARR